MHAETNAVATVERRAGVDWSNLFAKLARFRRTEFARSVVVMYGTQIILVAINFAISVIAARVLGRAGRGEYTAVVTTSALGVQFGNFGLTSSHTYHVAKEPKLFPILVSNSLAVSVAVGLFLAALAGIAVLVMPREALPFGDSLVLLLAAYVPLGVALMLLQQLLIAVRRSVIANGLDLLNVALKGGLIGLAFLLGIGTVETFFAAGVVALIVALPAALFIVCPRGSAPVQSSMPVLRDSAHYGFRVYLTILISFMATRVVDTFAVRWFCGNQALGVYAVAQGLAQFMLVFPQVVGQLIFPRLCQPTSPERKLALLRRAVLGMAALMIPGAVVAACCAGPFIRFCYGEDFVGAALPFIWLLPQVVLWSVESVGRFYLQSDGFRMTVLGAWAGTLALAIVLNLIFVPLWGITGAAAAASVAQGALTIMTLTLILKEKRSHA